MNYTEQGSKEVKHVVGKRERGKVNMVYCGNDS